MSFRYREDYNSPRYKKWRSDVFRRDRFTCIRCHKSGVYIQAHHIKKWIDFPYLRYLVSNGCTLCKKCHDLVTGREEDYEEQFMRTLAQRRIQSKRDKTKKRCNKRRNKKVVYKKPAWKPKNPRLQ